MNHKNFSKLAHQTRLTLSAKAAEEVMPELKDRMMERFRAIGEQKHEIGNPPLSRIDNLDTPYFEAAKEALKGTEKSALHFQKFRTLYIQQLMPVAMSKLLPKWMLGLFALLIVMIMISTDASRIFLISTAMAQDLVLPFRKNPMKPKNQMLLIKMLSILVALILFLGSWKITQMEYLSLFVTIVAGIWVSGAGSVMCFGLYSRFGTSAGAFAALISGFIVSVSGMVTSYFWAGHIYIWLDNHGWVPAVGRVFYLLSRPFHPYIVWEMNPHKFPINAFEISFISIVVSGFCYVFVSLCQTLRVSFRPFRISWREDKLFNLEKMLHRGKYADEKSKVVTTKWTLHNIFSKLIGISSEYTKGDRIIARAVFFYTFGYRFLLTFVLVVLLNSLSPWGTRGWSNYFFITTLAVPFVVGLISTVWFMVGGINDLRHLFIDLEARKCDFSDDGRVEKD